MKKIVAIIPFLLFGMLYSQVDRALVLNPYLQPFYHGVASGDPQQDRVIIWTRLTPDSLWVGPADVDWRVATDTGMTNIVQNGTYTTDQARDYTVKIDVTGLLPNTYYYYEFTFGGLHSIRGRTKTTPSSGADSLRFAVVSCANYEAGFFNAYRVIKERNDVDAVLHLGDYIYEYEHDGYAFNATANRIWEPPNEIIVLNDYRTRYATYHLDEDLLRLHQQYPFVAVWDDHESADNSWKDGAGNHSEGPEGTWIDRKAASRQAYFEWMPIREQAPGNDSVIYRSIEYGDLVEFIMLDTRIHGRDEQVGTTDPLIDDTSRTILGDDQFTWLKQRLSNSAKQWKVLGQQVMIAPLNIFGTPVNADQWDGYAADRLKLMNYVLDSNVTDVVAITGDIHTSWANDIPTASYNPSTGAGSAFVEFVTTSVTSPGLAIPVPQSWIMSQNEHIKYIDLTEKGFLILDINQLRTQSDWFYVNTIDQSDGGFSYGEGWYVNDGERHLNAASAEATPRPDVIHLQAPDWPRGINPTSVEEFGMEVMGIYPNPVIDNLYVQLYLRASSEIKIQLLDMKGSEVYNSVLGPIHEGLSNIVVPVQNLSTGTYILNLSVQGGMKRAKVIKK